MKITFFGSDKFSKLVLESFLSVSVKLKESVISELTMVLPYPGLSRQNPTAELQAYAKLSNIPFVHYSKNFKQIKEFVIERPQEVGIVASFGALIPSYIIDLYEKGIIVLHPSLLPKYRGACPIQHALMNGEKETGISVIEISKRKFDAGKILFQESLEIGDDDGYVALHDKLAIRGGQILVHCLQQYDQLLLGGVEQDPLLVTKAPFIHKEIAYLDWELMNNKQISALFRAINGSHIKPYSKLLIGKKTKVIYFELLTEYFTTSLDITSEIPLELEILPGALHWNIKAVTEYFLIKAKEGWVKCQGSVMIDGHRRGIKEFIVKYLSNQSYAKVAHLRFRLF